MPVTIEDIINRPFSSRNRDDKMRIIAEGRPRPFLNMAAVVTVKNEKNVQELKLLTQEFNPAIYDEVQWLAGCENRNSVFCWPCLLFKRSSGLWNSIGVSELAYLMEGMPTHEESIEHIQAAVQLQKLAELGAQETKINVIQYNEIVKRNREILKRLTDVVCNLLVKEQSFYERNKGCQLNPDNCVTNLQFLRTYDVLNCNFIEDAIDLIKISPNIINDLVDTIAKIVKLAIRKDVLASTYVSLILSDHTKIDKKLQISTVLRFIKEGKVSERFIGFLNMGDHRSCAEVYQHISNTILQFGISDRLLAISLDGGILPTNELQALSNLLKTVHPCTFFLPWYCHGVDYILQQSLTNVKECSVLLKAINEMKNFFNKKSKRYKSLETFMSDNLPSTKNTKWFVRSQFIQVLNKYRSYFILFFESILLNSTLWEADDVNKALGFQQILEDFQTEFLLQAFLKLFELVAPLSKIMKSANPEIKFSVEIADGVVEQLTKERDSGFTDLWILIHSKKSMELPGPLSKKVKPDMDDSRIPTYRELYNSIITVMIEEIKIRFYTLSQLSFCHLLTCDSSGNFKVHGCLIEKLMSVHGQYFDADQLKNELIVLCTNGKTFATKSVYGILEFFIKADFKNAFKCVYKLAELILTLPVKPSSETENFSKFEEIKDWSYVPDVLGIQTGDIGIPCVEIEYFQELKKSNSFHCDVAEVFYEVNKTFELLHN